MNEIETPRFGNGPVAPPVVNVCLNCPAFRTVKLGTVTHGGAKTVCGITNIRVSPYRVQCSLTDEQKATWADNQLTSSR
jgi:hypothetical protein